MFYDVTSSKLFISNGLFKTMFYDVISSDLMRLRWEWELDVSNNVVGLRWFLSQTVKSMFYDVFHRERSCNEKQLEIGW